MIFTGMSERSSGQIRGIQISEQLKKLGINSRFIDARDGSIHAVKNETVVFIRKIDRQIARHLKNQGCQIVFDILDRPVADIHESQRSGSQFSWSSYDIPELDIFIVNNSLVKEEIEKISNKMCVTIPHHSVGSEHRVRSSVISAGYIGLPDQIDNKEQIESLFEKLGVRFYSKNPLTREECIRDLKQIDLGIIFVKENARTNPVLKYKPNTKLTNFQSFGIPTISTLYHSFIEFGGNAWIQTGESSLLNDIEDLVSSPERLEKMSFDSIENSKKYSIEKVAQMYERLA